MCAIHATQEAGTPRGQPLPSGEARFPASAHGLAGHALYLDIDGTILDIAQTPEGVHVPDWLVPLLRRLSLKLDGALAFVSGRTLASIDELFAPLKLPTIAVHGAEIRANDQHEIFEEALAAELQRVAPLLRAGIDKLVGARLENKRSAIALHYRSAPERGREVLKLAELALCELGPEFGLIVGKCVVEIRPRHLNKGTALSRLMEQPPFRGRTPIFAGDDSTDEDAFAVVNRLGGISVRVGAAAPTAATYRLADPDALRGWLREIA
jgi:trehalose 6-phosphate phosphatase